MADRPSRDVMLAIVFDEQWRVRPEIKKRTERAYCTRRQHMIAAAIRTPFGWWVAWRQPYTDQGSRWEYDWADQVAGYTEATCNCRRRRRIDEIFRQLRYDLRSR